MNTTVTLVFVSQILIGLDPKNYFSSIQKTPSRISSNLAAKSCRILWNLAESCRVLQNLTEYCNLSHILVKYFRKIVQIFWEPASYSMLLDITVLRLESTYFSLVVLHSHVCYSFKDLSTWHFLRVRSRWIQQNIFNYLINQTESCRILQNLAESCRIL